MEETTRPFNFGRRKSRGGGRKGGGWGGEVGGERERDMNEEDEEEEYPEDVKPAYQSDLNARKTWLEAKYVEGRYCGVFSQEVVVKWKGKCGRYFLKMKEKEFELYADEDSNVLVEGVGFRDGTIRPYVSQEGALEWFDLVTRSGQVDFIFIFIFFFNF